MPRPPPGIGQALEGWLRSARAGPVKLRHKPTAHPLRNTQIEHALHTSRSASSSSATKRSPPPHWTTAARSWLKLVTDGVFATIKTSAYSHPHGPYRGARLPSNETTFAQTRRFATVRHTRPSLGPLASKQLALRSTALTVGLGNARGFASGAGQGVWSNIVANVPLGLRALGNEVGVLDDRKWNNVKRVARQRHKKQLHKNQSKVARALPTGLFLSKRDEFDQFFIATTQSSKEDQPSTGISDRLPVCLIVRAEPDLTFAGEYESDPADLRLLSPGVVSHFQTITSAYTKHARRIKALHDNLIRAGAFDDPATRTSAVVWRDYDGREIKEVHVSFPLGWTVGDVRNAVGDWLLDSRWCTVIDLEHQEQTKMADVLFNAQDDFDSIRSDSIHSSRAESEDVHFDVVNTFVLPSVDMSSAHSLQLSSPSLSSSDQLAWDQHFSDPGSASISWSVDDVEESSPWTDHPGTDHPAAPLATSYEQSLHDFLHEIDLAQCRS
ncbi:hypothetical protein OIV83_001391 [Microbotryomycetes sp. JL201]|nr:hypothetical protein OIV83_001391 [Microbotryomycetes sp. JL201]